MKIPKVIRKNNRKYIFVKKYPNYFMYQYMTTGVKECFSKYDLGLLKEMFEPSKDLFKIHKV